MAENHRSVYLFCRERHALLKLATATSKCPYTIVVRNRVDFEEAKTFATAWESSIKTTVMDRYVSSATMLRPKTVGTPRNRQHMPL